MASTTVPEQATVQITVPAGSILAAFSTGTYRVDQTLTFANYPNANSNLFLNSGVYTSAAFTNATVVTISAGIHRVLYNVGVAPVVIEVPNSQPAPGTLNSTGTLTATLILGGIVTSTTAAGVTATLDTGTVCDAALTMAVNDSFDWSAIATGANSFTVTASSGHTIVGSGVVATVTSGRFRTRKTAANTFVTYRLA